MATKDAVSAAVGTKPVEFNILSVTFDGFSTALSVNLPVSVSLIFAILIVVVGLKYLIGGFKGFGAEEVTIKDPFTGTEVKIKANTEDKKIAHRIWTELVTRKAALPFQRDKDVIVEVYDSWHTLFQCVREQIAAIPVEKLRGREKEDIESLIDISTKVLNEGLRPHLTEWQAKYRAWYESAKAASNGKSPQELQREYPEYSQLVDDITSVNRKLKEFADELKKIVRANQ
ncbi:hypothetical protein L8R85_23715 [Vibrio splendidus]|uniref:Uncharacterized protein n=1 Tax=Vibrio splendidus TaxID=29497 RepID=A0AA43G1V6_VIBSP|nr:hypothetical protein [Vibrio splendidus]MDH5924026.1 hypothetical protein [Vibrio splendidus]